LLALPLVVGVGTGEAQARQEIGEFPQENAWWQLTPSVIWDDETFTLEVHIVGRDDVQRVGVYNLESPETTDPVDPTDAEGDFISNYAAVLFDDGTRGDRVAGDGIFSREGLSPARVYWEGQNDSTGTFYGSVRVQYTDGQYADNSAPVFGAVVNSAYRDVFAVEEFGEGLSATAYAFFIDDAAHEVIDDYPVATVYCGTSNFMAYQKLYSVFPDVFDFAAVMPGMQLFRPDGFVENTPYEITVSDSAEHIGTSAIDQTATFGSSGRLRSTIYHSFGDIAIMDHEIAHAWGADIGESLGLVDEDGQHWNDLSDIGGQLGAYYFREDGQAGSFSYNGDGTWRFVDSIESQESDPYAPLELYIMGLLPPGEVPPIHVLSNPDFSDLDRVTAQSYSTVTIEDIMAAEGGERSPAFPDAQTDFTMAFIVTQDRPFSDAAYALFSLLAYDLTAPERFEQGRFFAPFQWATGGRATLDTRLPVDLPVPDLSAMVTTTVTTTTTVPTSTTGAPGTTMPSTSSSAPTTTLQPSQSEDEGSSGLPVVAIILAAVVVAAIGAGLLLRRRGDKG
jgi:hypothetical protein